MWYQIQLTASRELTEIKFDSGKEDFPITYSVSVSQDGKSWTKVGQGTGKPGINSVSWKSSGKYAFLKIDSEKAASHPWSMKNLTLYSR
jgi:hypothetical protein